MSFHACSNKTPVDKKQLFKSVSLNFIIKVTRNCNFRCAYCHDLSSENPKMGFEVLAGTTERILAADRCQNVRFIWHGGEPLLMGIMFYLKAVALQQTFRRKGQEIKNNIQTNGSLLDDTFVDFLRDFGFTVGVSLDGPVDLHNRQRRNSVGHRTYRQVLKGIGKLRKKDVPFGVITVLTAKSLSVAPGQLLSFYRDHGISNVCFIPVRSDCSGSGENLEASMYSGYMKDLFDAWLTMNDPSFKVREFSNWILLSVGLAGNLCSSAGSCVGSTFAIEPDGTTYHCDKFVPVDAFRYGGISELDFDQLPLSAKCAALKKNDLSLPRRCKKCSYQKYCAGGCGHDRFLEKTYGKENAACHMRDILTHVHSRIKTHPKVQEFMAASPQSDVLP